MTFTLFVISQAPTSPTYIPSLGIGLAFFLQRDSLRVRLDTNERNALKKKNSKTSVPSVNRTTLHVLWLNACCSCDPVDRSVFRLYVYNTVVVLSLCYWIIRTSFDVFGVQSKFNILTDFANNQFRRVRVGNSWFRFSNRTQQIARNRPVG